ncbi:hypothetical protein RRG08_022087 [Elysia crispata]|uniref:Uncharacterized protein n=1 Tax=Elysia crispata TaxID=231223 RepID=A0AAE1CR09_9GAST|nr:hypothetical protein RRG08_022087 [Elysia crispata]
MVKPPAWERSAWVEVGLAQSPLVASPVVTCRHLSSPVTTLQQFGLEESVTASTGCLESVQCIHTSCVTARLLMV